MQLVRPLILSAAVSFAGAPAFVSAQVPSRAFEASRAEIRHSIGTWDVTTEFLNSDGTVAQSVEGVYSFEWVVEDRIARGVSEQPALQQKSAILFYLRPAESQIEMSSVGGDGKLWVMTGALGDSVRTTPSVLLEDGTRIKLRFTRYNATADRFESRTERSTDDGKSWVSGNHQVFRRRKA